MKLSDEIKEFIDEWTDGERGSEITICSLEEIPENVEDEGVEPGCCIKEVYMDVSCTTYPCGSMECDGYGYFVAQDDTVFRCEVGGSY